ncbi:hypothetical protein FGO68_gene2554 [Halteria grandinella]|uniref:Uncharacterized protein n=1 Tax=Halteria grandinella TaxID=5974 RepID=A0A8J8P4J2_HALGN|nr:hypothetical protein FGO68_gene2554 [Halteria grandinella]
MPGLIIYSKMNDPTITLSDQTSDLAAILQQNIRISNLVIHRKNKKAPPTQRQNYSIPLVSTNEDSHAVLYQKNANKRGASVMKANVGLLTGREDPYESAAYLTKRDAETQQSLSHIRASKSSSRELKRSLTPIIAGFQQKTSGIGQDEVKTLKTRGQLDLYNAHFQDEMNLLGSKEGLVVLPFKLSTMKKSRQEAIMPLTNNQIKSLTENKPFNSTIRQLPLISHQEDQGSRKRLLQNNSSTRNGYDELKAHMISSLSAGRQSTLNKQSFMGMIEKVKQQALKYNSNFSLNNADLAENNEYKLSCMVPEIMDSLNERDSSVGKDVTTIVKVDNYERVSLLNSQRSKLSLAATLNQKNIKAMARKLDVQEMEFDELKRTVAKDPTSQFDFAKQTYGLYENLLFQLLSHLQRSTTSFDEEFLSLFERSMNGINLANQHFNKLIHSINDDYLTEISDLNRKITHLEDTLTKTRSQLLEESQMFTDQSKKTLEAQVKDFLSHPDQALSSYDKLRDQIFYVMEDSQYSGVNGDLKEIFSFLNFYKHVHKELVIETQRIGENEGEMTDKDLVIENLAGDVDSKMKETQVHTAKKVLQRYYRNIKWVDEGCQTISEEDQIEELKMLCRDKDDTIRILNQQAIEAAISIKQFEDKCEGADAKLYEVQSQLKVKSKNLEDLFEEYQQYMKDTDIMRNKFQDIKDELADMKRDRNVLKEEISKLKIQLKMQQMVTQKSLVTQLTNASLDTTKQQEPQAVKHDNLQQQASFKQQLTLPQSQQERNTTSRASVSRDEELSEEPVSNGRNSKVRQSLASSVNNRLSGQIEVSKLADNKVATYHNEYRDATNANRKSQQSQREQKRDESFDSQASSLRVKVQVSNARETKAVTDNKDINQLMPPNHAKKQTNTSVKKEQTREVPAKQVTQQKSPNKKEDFIKIDKVGEITLGENGDDIFRSQNPLKSDRSGGGIIRSERDISNKGKSNPSPVEPKRIINLSDPANRSPGRSAAKDNVPRFSNGQIGQLISNLDKYEQTYDSARNEGGINEQAEFTINRQSSGNDLKTITMTERSLITPLSVPALYIQPKPIVSLQKYKDGLTETSQIIDKFLEGKRGHRNVCICHCVDKGVQAGFDNGKYKVGKTIQTQTKLTGNIRDQAITKEVQVEARADLIDREIERDNIEIKNIKKLYGQLSTSRLSKKPSHSPSPLNTNRNHPTVKIYHNNKVDQESQTDCKIVVKSSIGGGGDAFAKEIATPKHHNLLFYDKKEAFTSTRLM